MQHRVLIHVLNVHLLGIIMFSWRSMVSRELRRLPVLLIMPTIPIPMQRKVLEPAQPQRFVYVDRRLGGANQPGNRFVSFVRAYARSGCLVKTGLGSHANPSSLFPFSLGDPSLFPLGSVNLSEINLGSRDQKESKGIPRH